MATTLGLVKIINQVSDPKTKYPKLFEGIGKNKGVPIKLHIYEIIRPVEERHRRTPFHLRNNVERELNKRLEQEIIERIEGTPTSWVSPVVTLKRIQMKFDFVSICVIQTRLSLMKGIYYQQ